MAEEVTLTAPGQNYTCDGHVDELDGGKIKIKAADNTLLMTYTFGTPAFGAAGASVAGRAAANAIANTVAVASGIAAKATIHKSDDTQLMQVLVGTSASNINLDTINIVAGSVYSMDTFYINMPDA